MNIAQRIKNAIDDPLESFKSLQRIIATVCIAIPALLWAFDKEEYYPQRVQLMNLREMKSYLLSTEMDSIKTLFKSRLSDQLKLTYCDSTIEINGLGKIPKDNLGFRMSISDYAYSSNSYLFGMLYMMAAMLYIYNGMVYLKKKETLDVQRKGSWYNVIIGLCLIGVVLNPQSTRDVLHNFFSVLFFLGNVLVMIAFPKPHETRIFKVARIIMGSACILIFLGVLPGLNFYSILWAEWMSLTIIAVYLITMASQVHCKDV